MKKLSMLLAILLFVAVCSFPTAAATSDAYSMYRSAVQELRSLDSLEYEWSSTFGKSNASDTREDFTGYRIQRLRSGDDVLARNMEVLANGKTKSSYFKDGYHYYRDNFGNKIKEAYPTEKIMKTMSVVPQNCTEADFKDATITETSTGQRITFSEYEKGSGATITTTFDFDKSGLLTEYETRATFSDYSYDYAIVTTFKVVSRNQLESIKFPADLGEYKEVKAER